MNKTFFYNFAGKMKHEIVIHGTGELEQAAAQFLSQTEGRNIIALHAPMGAGKTTFTSAICKVLGVKAEEVSSPTFAIVNEYRRADGSPIYHFDFYRIDNIAEALDIGFNDYMDSGDMCIMEWAENIEPILPEETLVVDINVLDDGTRVLSWND